MSDRGHIGHHDSAANAECETGLCGTWVGVPRRCRKSRRESTFVEAERPGPVEPHEPLVRGPKCRLNTRAYLALVGFRRDEQRAESGVITRALHRVVVRPGARAAVLDSAAEFSRDCGTYGSWISSRPERDGCFVNIGDALGCQASPI